MVAIGASRLLHVESCLADLVLLLVLTGAHPSYPHSHACGHIEGSPSIPLMPENLLCGQSHTGRGERIKQMKRASLFALVGAVLLLGANAFAQDQPTQIE